MRSSVGMVACTSSNDEPLPVLCEVDESRYEVEHGYKIGWKPIEPYGQKKKGIHLHNVNGYAKETYYQSDFNSLVHHGTIKLYIEA